MNKISIFAAVLLGSLAMFSCNKESDKESACIPEGAVMLSTEGFRGDEKTSVSDNSVQWTGTDESIRFYVGGVGANEQTLAVSVIGDNAFVPGITGSGAIRGYYPVSIITADGASDHETAPTVVVPDSYDSRYIAGRQEIALPMVASAASGAGEIEFKHVTAAVKVLVKNETGFDLTLDKVVVSSSAYKLSGTVDATLADNNLGLIPQAGSGSVTVRFTDAPTIAAGGDDLKDIQVPILPIGESQLTIEVYTHSKVGTVLGIEGLTNANYDFHYSCTPEGNTPALGRNHMATARIALKRAANTSSPATMTEIDHSLFTVENLGGGNYRKVRFSKGNLQYLAAATGTYSANTWRFAENQYDYIGSANSNIASDYAGWIDLFGWGTSGISSYSPKANRIEPYSTSNADGDYYAYGANDANLYSNSGKADWGYNAISNGGNSENSGWRSPKMDEWTYMLESRNYSYKYAKGNIHSTNGIIVFPDEFDPSENDVTISNANTSNSAYISYSDADWTKLEDAGCIFLPAAGYREGTTVYDYGTLGRYWSSKYHNSSSANRINFNKTSVYFSSPSYTARHFGASVRLVRNAN